MSWTSVMGLGKPKGAPAEGDGMCGRCKVIHMAISEAGLGLPTVPGMTTFEFDAQLISVVDGDSVRLFLDRGFSDTSVRKLRLMGVDTPEIFRGSPLERRAGTLASVFVARWFRTAQEFHLGDPRWPLRVRTIKPSKYGDILVRVWRHSDEEELGLRLLDEELARIYLGEKKRAWPQEQLQAIIDRHS